MDVVVFSARHLSAWDWMDEMDGITYPHWLALMGLMALMDWMGWMAWMDGNWRPCQAGRPFSPQNEKLLVGKTHSDFLLPISWLARLRNGALRA